MYKIKDQVEGSPPKVSIFWKICQYVCIFASSATAEILVFTNLYGNPDLGFSYRSVKTQILLLVSYQICTKMQATDFHSARPVLSNQNKQGSIGIKLKTSKVADQYRNPMISFHMHTKHSCGTTFTEAVNIGIGTLCDSPGMNMINVASKLRSIMVFLFYTSHFSKA